MDIVQSVEGAIKSAETHVEAEAKKVETACEHTVLTCSKCAATVTIHLANMLKADAKDTLTQAEKDAEEDLAVTRGIASRLWHRLWSHV